MPTTSRVSTTINVKIFTLFCLVTNANATFHESCAKPPILERLAESFIPGRFPPQNGIDRGTLLLCELEHPALPTWIFKGCELVRDTKAHKSWLKAFQRKIISTQFDQIISMGEYCHATMYFYIFDKEHMFRLTYQISYELTHNDVKIDQFSFIPK